MATGRGGAVVLSKAHLDRMMQVMGKPERRLKSCLLPHAVQHCTIPSCFPPPRSSTTLPTPAARRSRLC